MLKRYRNSKAEKRRAKQDGPKVNPFEQIKVFLPVHHAAKLKVISDTKGTPVSRLIAMAVYYAFENNFEFELDYSVPKYDPLKYSDEGRAVYQFIQTQKTGISLESLVLCADQMMINATGVCIGVEILLKNNLIEEYTPSGANLFKYTEGVKFYRVKEGMQK